MSGSIAQRILGLLHPRGAESVGEEHRTDLSAPLDQARYVVFDTELTGLNPRQDSIVSVGAVAMTGGRIEVGSTFYQVVVPRTALRGSSVVVHGITPSEVLEQPSIDQVLPAFLEFCGDSVIIGHVVSIDLGFLNEDLVRLRGRKLPNPAVDTHAVSRWLQSRESEVCAFYGGNADGTDLFTLAARYGIPLSGAHNALSDAFVTAQLFQRFLALLPKRGVVTVRDLVRIGKP